MKFSKIVALVVGILTGILTSGYAAARSEIRLDQIGFYPSATKTAIVLNVTGGSFSILSTKGNIVLSGQLKQAPAKTFGGATAYIADFSDLKKTGRFYIKLSNGDTSKPFAISDHVYDDLAKAVVKAYYFQRASIALPERYAGKWHRDGGHPDDKVLIHSSAGDAKRPAGTIISAPGGWYDAGDYNKYIVNSGITMGTLLSSYEDLPAYVKSVRLNLPETGNGIPDLLNEVLWNLRWMLAMQDPNDGGVYHKLTNANFDPMIMPDKAIKPRYVVQKSTAATLDLAAVMAQSARVFANYKEQLPGLADSCLKAAIAAWNWAKLNPRVFYIQDEINKKYQPAIVTGEYGDKYVDDERIWAALEMYITTRDDNYIKDIGIEVDMPIPSWAQVKLMGYYSLARHRSNLTRSGTKLANIIVGKITKLADSLVKIGHNNAYQTVMTADKKNFIWGSNSVAAEQGVELIQAYLLTGKPQYLDAAMSNLNYLLGQNATGYCYVTGFGHNSPMHPHHRPSVADGVTDPIPGLLVAGPNPGMQDHIQLKSLVPDEAYIDDDRAYAVNEIAINWNAPLAYLLNAINAAKKSK